VGFGNWPEQLSRAACRCSTHRSTGSKSHAAAGELTFLVGGAANALEVARPALAVMSRAILHLGSSGSGALLKLINNFVLRRPGGGVGRSA